MTGCESQFSEVTQSNMEIFTGLPDGEKYDVAMFELNNGERNSKVPKSPRDSQAGSESEPKSEVATSALTMNGMREKIAKGLFESEDSESEESNKKWPDNVTYDHLFTLEEASDVTANDDVVLYSSDLVGEATKFNENTCDVMASDAFPMLTGHDLAKKELIKYCNDGQIEVEIKQRVLSLPTEGSTPLEKHMYYNAQVHAEMCRRAVQNMLDKVLIGFDATTSVSVVERDDFEYVGTNIERGKFMERALMAECRREDLTDHFLESKTWPAPHVIEGRLFRAARFKALREKKLIERSESESMGRRSSDDSEWVASERTRSEGSEWLDTERGSCNTYFEL